MAAKFDSGTTVVHQDNPQFGMGIVFSTFEGDSSDFYL